MKDRHALSEHEQSFFSDMDNEFLKEGGFDLDTLSEEEITKEAEALLEDGEVNFQAPMHTIKIAAADLEEDPDFIRGVKDELRLSLPEWYPSVLAATIGL